MTLSAAVVLAVTAILIPFLAWSSKQKLDRGLVVERLPLYIEALVVQSLLLALALWAIRASDLPVHIVADQRTPFIPAALALLAVALATMMLAFHRSSHASKRRVLMIVPRSRREKLLWIAVSAAAGIGEETLYRGALFALLAPDAGVAGAAVASSLLFALAHLVQGWKSTAIIAVFGLGFQLLVVLSGSLLGAILVHFLYDLLAGLYMSRFHESVLPEEPADVPNL